MALEIGGRGVPREGTDDLRVEVIAAKLEAWFGRQSPPVPVPQRGWELDLFEAGLMDSFLVVLLVEHLEEWYQVRLPDDSVGSAQLATIDRVARLVVQLGNEKGPGFDG